MDVIDVISVTPPYSEYAERAVLGAAILKAEDMRWLREITKRARGRDFDDCLRGWTWERLRWYANWGRPPLLKWLEADGVFRKFEETFKPASTERLPVMICQWIATDFWWNADYYLDVVLAMSKARHRMFRAADELKSAVELATELHERQHALGIPQKGR